MDAVRQIAFGSSKDKVPAYISRDISCPFVNKSASPDVGHYETS